MERKAFSVMRCVLSTLHRQVSIQRGYCLHFPLRLRRSGPIFEGAQNLGWVDRETDRLSIRRVRFREQWTPELASKIVSFS